MHWKRAEYSVDLGRVEVLVKVLDVWVKGPDIILHQTPLCPYFTSLIYYLTTTLSCI